MEEIILDNTIKNQIKTLCNKVFDLVKKENTKISSALIQFNNGDIFVGSTGVNANDYCKYYSSTNTTQGDDELQKLMKDVNTIELINITHKALLNELFKKENKQSNIKSYNIIYKSKENKIFLCKNRIGSVSIKKSQIVPEF